MNPGISQHNLLCVRPLPLSRTQLSYLLNGNANSGTSKIQVGTSCCPEATSPPRSLELLRGPGQEKRAGVDVTAPGAGWGVGTLPAGTQKQLINQDGGLLIHPGCGCYRSRGRVRHRLAGSPGLGGGHGTAKSAESGQQDRSDAQPSRRPRLPRRGKALPAG